MVYLFSVVILTNHHKFNCLNNTHLLSYSSIDQKSSGCGWVIWPDPVRSKSRCQPPRFPYRGSGERSGSKLILVVGRNQSQAVVGLGSSIPAWLSTKGSSQLVETAHLPWLMAPPSSKPAMASQVFSYFQWFLTPLLPHLICLPFLLLRAHVITRVLLS